MKYFRKLAGKRIYLSPINAEDVEQYVAWLNDPVVTDRTGSVSKVISLDSEKEWLSKNNTRYQFAIVNNNEDKLIGSCGFNEMDQIHRSGTVGIFIGDKENRGKGYGTETLNLLLKYGFDSLNLHSINLNVFSFNEQAMACYKKCGFKEAGRMREAYFCNGKFHDIIKMDILENEFRDARTN